MTFISAVIGYFAIGTGRAILRNLQWYFDERQHTLRWVLIGSLGELFTWPFTVYASSSCCAWVRKSKIGTILQGVIYEARPRNTIKEGQLTRARQKMLEQLRTPIIPSYLGYPNNFPTAQLAFVQGHWAALARASEIGLSFLPSDPKHITGSDYSITDSAYQYNDHPRLAFIDGWTIAIQQLETNGYSWRPTDDTIDVGPIILSNNC